jgi:hypothetical protein
LTSQLGEALARRVHSLNRAVVGVTKIEADRRQILNAGNILRPGDDGRVRTAIRVQQDAPLYEQPESFNSELVAFAGS